AVLKMVISVPAALEPPKTVTAYALDPSAAEIKMTKERQRVIDFLADGAPSLPLSDLAKLAAVSPSVIKGLLKAGALQTIEMTATLPSRPQPDGNAAGPLLSDQQSQAGDELAAKTKVGRYSVTLLDGVPGAGKTEVYFQAVAEALKQGRQALVLLPEIALSAQWMARFIARFGAEPMLWHSDLSPAQRRDTWRHVAAGRARVVVGARSALLLPYPDLALIVVDEEHESAFKQEEGVIYNARDMAIVRARLSDIPVVLASATPSLETVANVEAGRYQVLHLPDRHGGAELPRVSLIDMRDHGPSGGHWLSPVLSEALTETFAAGEQAMLFLNRRGYAPLTLCRTCGHRFQCPHCTAWLVEHRRAHGSHLQCHHCGYGTALPERCPSCDKQGTFAACGPGVQRLAEEVALAFPHIRTEIAASDTVVGPDAAAALVRRMENHETDLVIGTQIVAKGYHFPMLTLVGVIDADLGLTGGDLRAAERTFQLLYQVAGRAGRAQRPGR
ncbi:MAG TPA: primosomal protein N', partial [Rhodospirillales bacterium]|nr:primosomal protein N' [Rhodospirillales bacterium]